MLRNLLVVFHLIALSAPACAHDVWLALEGDRDQRRVIVNYGHPDDRPPASADKLVNLDAITGEGSRSLLNGVTVRSNFGPIVVQSAPITVTKSALYAAQYDNGFWSKIDGDFRNATRRLMPNANETVWSGKFAKAVDGPEAPFAQVLGHDLEIVPLSDPAATRQNDILKVRVLFYGKPLIGAEVERGDGATAMPEAEIPRFKTDADGVASVPVSNRGPTLLVVDHRVSPSGTPDQADADLFNATLWFEVP